VWSLLRLRVATPSVHHHALQLALQYLQTLIAASFSTEMQASAPPDTTQIRIGCLYK
jgi:hypothetical protein